MVDRRSSNQTARDRCWKNAAAAFKLTPDKYLFVWKELSGACYVVDFSQVSLRLGMVHEQIRLLLYAHQGDTLQGQLPWCLRSLEREIFLERLSDFL